MDRSPSSRRAWIEISLRTLRGIAARSPSSRRAWIEIRPHRRRSRCRRVALLAEGVDRNIPYSAAINFASLVALLAEGVDRNLSSVVGGAGGPAVALLAEGVDRNSSNFASLTSL